MPFHVDRFSNSMKEPTNQTILDQLMQDRATYDNLTTPIQTVRWIRSLIDDLIIEVGSEEAKRVMESCGKQCIRQSVLIKARQLQKESRNIDELLVKLNQALIGGGKLHRDADTIHASYERCYCGSVSKTPQLISAVYCHCSCGWYQKLFESILERPIEVELVDSIIHGADSCQFIIHI